MLMKFPIFKTVTLLYSVLLISGCSSKHIVIDPIDNTTLSGMQKEYEHIPKPISDIKQPLSEQRQSMAFSIKQIFDDIDAYKKSLYAQQYRKYGKNKTYATNIPPKSNQKSSIQNTNTRLYPKMPKHHTPKDVLKKAKAS